MARGGLSKFLEFIGLVDDEPETAYNRQPAGGQTYTPPRRGAENARPVRRSLVTARLRVQGGVRQSAYARALLPGSMTATAARAAEPRPSIGPPRRRIPHGRFGPIPRQAPRQDYSARPAQPARPPRPTGAIPSGMNSSALSSRSSPEERHRMQTIPGSAVIYYLHTLEECRDVITDLMDSKTVLLNLEEMEEKTIQRGIDTLCGAAFALGATLRKASDKTYLIAPNNVEVAMTNEADRRY
jgi:FtsZ-interacting cell division protein YlmF